MTDTSVFTGKLLDAVRNRQGLAPLSDTMDLDEATALDVQEAVVQARIDAGFPLVGAKLGLTSKAKMQQMHVDRPLYGWLTSDMWIDVAVPVRCSDYIQPRVEPEIAFLLGADLDQVGLKNLGRLEHGAGRDARAERVEVDVDEHGAAQERQHGRRDDLAGRCGFWLSVCFVRSLVAVVCCVGARRPLAQHIQNAHATQNALDCLTRNIRRSPQAAT